MHTHLYYLKYQRGYVTPDRENGFSLIEVLVALVILSIGFLGTASLLTGIIKGNTVSKNITIATNLAKNKMEDLGRMSYSALPAVNTTQTENWGSITSYPTFRRLTKTFVNSPSPNMKRVAVEVYWKTGTNPVILNSIFVEQ